MESPGTDDNSKPADGGSTEPLPMDVESRVLRLYKPVWIGYTEAIEIRNSIERLASIPYSGRITSCAIVAPSYNGKTSLFRSICRRMNPPAIEGESERLSDRPSPTLPVFFMQVPPSPDEDRILDAMLRTLHMLGPARESRESKIARIQAMFAGLKVKLVLLDEFGFFVDGTPDKQRKSLNALKYLSNLLEVPIAISTVEAGLNVLTSHEEIANRFPAKFLPKWTAKREATARMLRSLEGQLGLKEASDLASERMVKLIVSSGNEILGHIHDLLRLLAERAIRSGTERITEADLTPDALKSIGWIHPTLRHERPAQS